MSAGRRPLFRRNGTSLAGPNPPSWHRRKIWPHRTLCLRIARPPDWQWRKWSPNRSTWWKQAGHFKFSGNNFIPSRYLITIANSWLFKCWPVLRLGMQFKYPLQFGRQRAANLACSLSDPSNESKRVFWSFMSIFLLSSFWLTPARMLSMRTSCTCLLQCSRLTTGALIMHWRTQSMSAPPPAASAGPPQITSGLSLTDFWSRIHSVVIIMNRCNKPHSSCHIKLPLAGHTDCTVTYNADRLI